VKDKMKNIHHSFYVERKRTSKKRTATAMQTKYNYGMVRHITWSAKFVTRILTFVSTPELNLVKEAILLEMLRTVLVTQQKIQMG